MSKRTAVPASDEPRPDRDLLDDPDLIEFTERLPEARKVSIKVMSESGNWKYRGSVAKDSFNLDSVQRRFGGGTYQFSIHGADGRLLKTISNIEIDDLSADEQEPEKKTAAVAVSGSSELELLRAQLAQNQIMMMKFIETMGQRQQAPAQQSDIVQLVNALQVMKQMEPKREQPPQVQDLLVQAFTRGMEVAERVQKKATGGDASPLGEILGFAREIFQDARPIIQAAIANATPGGNVATRATIPGDEEMDETEIDLKPALQHVKEHLRGGTPPNTLAHLVLAQMQANPELDETLSALITEQPIESFLELDPELKEEPLRTTFGKFFGEMRARILQAGDTRRSGGNPENAGDHAGSDTRLG